MGGLVHFLGVEGQTAEWAQRGWHLQTWLEALPAEPAGDRDRRLLPPCWHKQSSARPAATASSADSLVFLSQPQPTPSRTKPRGELYLQAGQPSYLAYPLQPVPPEGTPLQQGAGSFLKVS